MTQGSSMNPNTHPAAIVAPAVAQATILRRWKAQKQHSALQHALYALARLAHSARNSKDEGYARSEAFYEAALTKMVRTFGPVRKSSKILGGGVKPFGALYTNLGIAKGYGTQTPAGNVQGSYLLSDWGLTLEELQDVRELATQLFMDARARGDDGLLKLAPPVTPPREKVPYTGPRS